MLGGGVGGGGRGRFNEFFFLNPLSIQWTEKFKNKWKDHYYNVGSLVKLIQEKSVVRGTDCPDMTKAVDWDVKNQTKINDNFNFVMCFRHYFIQVIEYHNEYDPPPLSSRRK